MIWLYLFSRICGWSRQAVYLHAEYLLCCDGSIRTGILLQRLSEDCCHCQFVHNFVLCLYDGEDFCRADQSFYISTSTLTLSIFLLWQEISRSVTTDSSYQCMQLQVHSLLWIINSFMVTLCCHSSLILLATYLQVFLLYLWDVVWSPFSLFEIPTLLFLYCLWVVDWAPYSVVPLLSVGCLIWAIYFVIPSLSVWCCLSSLLCCSFTICGLMFELPTQLFLHFLWVVVWCPYSVVVGCCLMSLLCCSFTNCRLLFDVHTVLFLH